MSHSLQTDMSRPVNISDSDFIRILTSRQVTVSIPVLGFMALLMLIGTCGNLLVILTYARRLQKSSTNVFIFCLAVFDITNCCVGIPMEMFDIFNPFTNDLHHLCAIYKFIAFSADLSSGYIIVCISYDRYLRIAAPHDHGLSVNHSKKAVIVISVVAVLVSSLSLFIYGSEQVPLSSRSKLFGYHCGVHAGAKNTVLPLLFNTLILVCFGVGVTILLIVYTRLGIRVRDWNKGRTSKEKCARSNPQGSSMYSEESSSKTENQDPPETQQRAPKPVEGCTPVLEYKDTHVQELESFQKPGFVRELSRSLDKKHFLNLENQNLNDGTKTLPLVKKSTSFKTVRKASLPALIYIKRRIKLSKTTIMFIAATVAFVASHVPYVCIKMALILSPNFIQRMTSAEYSLFRFAEYSFVVSYGVNPLIYSFLNPKFRNECRTLIAEVVKCCRSRVRSFNVQ